MRALNTVNLDVCEFVNGLTRLEKVGQHLFGIFGLQQRPVASLRHPFPERIKVRSKPDGYGFFPHQIPGLRIEIRAAPCGQHMRRSIKQPRQNLLFAPPEFRLPMQGKDFRDRQTGSLLNLLVTVIKVASHRLREATSDSRLSGPHEPNQRDRPIWPDCLISVRFQRRTLFVSLGLFDVMNTVLYRQHGSGNHWSGPNGSKEDAIMRKWLMLLVILAISAGGVLWWLGQTYDAQRPADMEMRLEIDHVF